MLSRIKTLSRRRVVTLSFFIMIAVGLADYLTGYDISFSVFYLLAIGVAVWFVGRRFAILISALSIATWLAADWAAGATYSSSFTLVWNAVITLVFYMVVVWLLSLLKSSQETLEERVRQRTVALTEEILERERLEKEILSITEREQQRIGCDLHDGLCQHLTGTAIAGLLVEQNLTEANLPTAAKDVKRLVDLVEEGISLARDIAHGLAPIQFDPRGLTDALQELAATTRERIKIDCRFECDSLVLVDDTATVMHLYRIAQEALNNAVRHGRANCIIIRFSAVAECMVLVIKDDGCGLPSLPSEGKGIGLRIMKHRATMIGASFSASRDPAGGTIVMCSLPIKNRGTEVSSNG